MQRKPCFKSHLNKKYCWISIFSIDLVKSWGDEFVLINVIELLYNFSKALCYFWRRMELYCSLSRKRCITFVNGLFVGYIYRILAFIYLLYITIILLLYILIRNKLCYSIASSNWKPFISLSLFLNRFSTVCKFNTMENCSNIHTYILSL